MVAGTRVVKSRYLSLLVALCLVLVFFLLLNNIQTVKIAKISQVSVDGRLKSPGAYLKYLEPNQSSFCKLNYGLPTQLVYNKEDLSGTPEFDQNSPFNILYGVIEGQPDQDGPGVTYVTHLTKDFVLYISEVVRYWEGPVSVAAYIPDGDPKGILESMLHLCYCIPEISKVSLHFVFKKDMQLNFYLSKLMPPRNCDIQDIVQMNSGHNLSNSDIRNNSKKDLDNWYPINVCRNAARQAAYTEFILVCDIELMPSKGLASRFLDMTESYKCIEPDCGKRVFVVPVFEVESTEDVPRTKRQLVDLMKRSKAVYFHQLSCAHCQKFPGLEQWKESDPGDLVKPLIETRREVPYHRWEPIYIGTKNEPMYYEKLSWEGFQDKMLQMLEMCLAGYKLIVLDGAFLVHWPGIKVAKRKDEPWRTPFVKKNQEFYNMLEMCLAGYKLIVLDGAFLVHWPGIKVAKRKDEPWRTPFVKKNQEFYNVLLKNVTSKYLANQHCKVE